MLKKRDLPKKRDLHDANTRLISEKTELAFEVAKLRLELRRARQKPALILLKFSGVKNGERRVFDAHVINTQFSGDTFTVDSQEGAIEVYAQEL